jgi:hypothetical protein
MTRHPFERENYFGEINGIRKPAKQRAGGGEVVSESRQSMDTTIALMFLVLLDQNPRTKHLVWKLLSALRRRYSPRGCNAAWSQCE